MNPLTNHLLSRKGRGFAIQLFDFERFPVLFGIGRGSDPTERHIDSGRN